MSLLHTHGMIYTQYHRLTSVECNLFRVTLSPPALFTTSDNKGRLLSELFSIILRSLANCILLLLHTSDCINKNSIYLYIIDVDVMSQDTWVMSFVISYLKKSIKCSIINSTQTSNNIYQCNTASSIAITVGSSWHNSQMTELK